MAGVGGEGEPGGEVSRQSLRTAGVTPAATHRNPATGHPFGNFDRVPAGRQRFHGGAAGLPPIRPAAATSARPLPFPARPPPPGSGPTPPLSSAIWALLVADQPGRQLVQVRPVADQADRRGRLLVALAWPASAGGPRGPVRRTRRRRRPFRPHAAISGSAVCRVRTVGLTNSRSIAPRGPAGPSPVAGPGPGRRRSAGGRCRSCPPAVPVDRLRVADQVDVHRVSVVGRCREVRGGRTVARGRIISSLVPTPRAVSSRLHGIFTQQPDAPERHPQRRHHRPRRPRQDHPGRSDAAPVRPVPRRSWTSSPAGSTA